MGLFSNYPIVNYKFGDNEAPALFQNLTIYVDLVDQIKSDINFYETLTIEDGERPDTLSYKLYETTEYYWMLYLINDKLRTSGWPLTQQELVEKSRVYYPNEVITTGLGGDMDNYDLFADYFTVGKRIRGQSSAVSGIILERNLDLLQMVVQKDAGFGSDQNFRTTEIVEVDYEDIETRRTTGLVKRAIQYDSIHHYEDTSGNWVDLPFPTTEEASSFTYSTLETGLVPITVFDRLTSINEDLKQINVLKPQVATQVFNEYQKLLKNNL
jgi:hypothetical protein